MPGQREIKTAVRRTQVARHSQGLGLEQAIGFQPIHEVVGINQKLLRIQRAQLIGSP